MSQVHLGLWVGVWRYPRGEHVVTTGRSSMKIDVAAWSRKRASPETYRVTHATFTFVAIDEEGRPRALDAA